jgi:radical SAM protein with 4Fe4S-binding SPASM domain
LTITGGEPLLRNDFWDIISYAREKKFSILLKSNGTLIDNDVAKKLYEHCVTEVHVSIYSMDESKHDYMTGLKGSLRSTIKAVEHLKENGITVRISCPVTNLTIGAVKEIKKYADQIGTICGFDLIITKQVTGDNDPVKLRLTDGDITYLFNDEELYDSIFVEDDTSVVMSETIDNAFDPEESICGGGNYLIAVNAYGDVFPCIAWQQKCGNINDHGIKHIWDQSQTLNQIRGYKNKDLGECIRCESLMHCPRCPGVIYHETGSINHKMDMMCLIAENLKIKSSEKLREKI